ncbi:hypothetical protein TrLO_g8958 [Triparma laevis f. longispina]|uniref:Tyrosine-protein kinase ephrin type A/B receptor-like domain-containing protein n=1 Tax=Triparma laevis f. longispina TaxID=1714387 RepID=A0A9W7FT32_9STRA|nr:hypothetical protein TrLO_g8958 [Triparma laevis f. longispina]
MACSNCAVGRYQLTFGGDGDCSQCTLGSIAYTPSSPTCLTCPAGQWHDSSSADKKCVFCEPNTFNENGEGDTCNLCEANSYSNAVASSCYSCLPGQRYESTSADDNKCVPCETNTYNENGEGETCTLCPSNSYSNPSSSSCYTCAPGDVYNDALIASQFGGKKCEPCPVATYSPTGNTCLPCVASNGYVNDITRAAICNYCGPGRRADVTTNTCQLCLVNEYSVGCSDTCSDCASGHSDPGSSSCINGPGEHSEEDASFCEKCPQYELYNKETDECECQDTFTRVEGVCTCTAGLTLPARPV